MRLIAGLGNPGKEYDKTRHNIGFVALDALAKELGVTGWKKFKEGELAEAMLDGNKVLLYRPLTFMNRSGQPLKQVISYYDIPLSDVAVMADDVYIAPGSVRIRRSGEAGGHNGWRSVISELGSQDYWRIKIGVGIYEQHPEKRMHQPALDKYVLQPLSHSEHKLAEKLIDKMLPNLIKWLQQGELQEETLHIS